MKTIANEFTLWSPWRKVRLYDDGSATITTTSYDADGRKETTRYIPFETYAAALVEYHKQETTEAAYHNYEARKAAKKKTFTPAIDYDAIVYAAEDVFSGQGWLYKQRVKNGYKKGDECPCWFDRNKNVADAASALLRYQDVLSGICRATGVSYDAAMRAARAINRWYCKTGMEHRPDAESLLRALS